MGMVKKLSKTGTSYSVILDKPLMQLLSITPDTLLELKTDGKFLILTPIEQPELDESAQDPDFQNALAKSKGKFGTAYQSKSTDICIVDLLSAQVLGLF